MGAFSAGWYNPTITPDAQPMTRLLTTDTHVGMSIFPRKGTDNFTFHEDEVIIKTKTKSYTAFDAKQLLEDTGLGLRIPALDFIRNDADLHDFAHPGVKTYVTYGYGIGTPAYFEFAEDFSKNQSAPPPLPVNYRNVSGDDIVPERSGQRSRNWDQAMAQENLLLMHKGFVNQPHALCLLPKPIGVDNCFNEVMGLIINGTLPPGASTNMPV